MQTHTSRVSQRRMVRTLAALTLAGTFAAGVGATEAPAPERLIVFGDGLSDTGNAYAASLEGGGEYPASPYFDGRFSDGPIWIEVLASRLRMPPPEPSFRGGLGYAWGGAVTGRRTDEAAVPGLGDQVDAFLEAGGTVGPGDLVVIWAGAEDFHRSDFGLSAELPDPTALVQTLSGTISRLASEAGAPRFLVVNLPPLGQTPRARWLGENVDAELPGYFDRLSAQFNNHLAAELSALEMRLGIEILQLDADALTREVLAAPGRFGFTDAETPARPLADSRGAPADARTPGTGTPLEPGTHLFFDAVHPSAAWHELLADRALALLDRASEPIQGE